MKPPDFPPEWPRDAVFQSSGACRCCGAPWGPWTTDMDGWSWNAEGSRWDRCPACQACSAPCGGHADPAAAAQRAYRLAVADAEKNDPDRYRAWLHCRRPCKAFDTALRQTKPHLATCPSLVYGNMDGH